MADLGADVVHVELPNGDPMRGFATFWNADFSLAGSRNAFYEDLNRNKRGVSLDLRAPADLDSLFRLIGRADVLITNLRESALERLGVDYASIRESFPTLVYAQGSAFGSRGTLRDSPGNEMIGLARSGLMDALAAVDEPPRYPVAGLIDRLGGIGLALGLIAALLHRQRTGEGQKVETSLLGWAINVQSVGTQLMANTGQEVRAPARHDAADPLYNIYLTRDGVWVALGMVDGSTVGHRADHWPRICAALGTPELASDPAYMSAAARRANARQLIAILDEAFANVDVDAWLAACATGDLISDRVNSSADLVHDDQVWANGYLESFDHPDLGTWTYVTTPLSFSATPTRIRRPAPGLGEHNAEVLDDWLAGAAPEVRDE